MLCTVWTRINLNCVAYKCPLSLVYPTHFFQVRQRWLSKTVSPTGLGMMKAVKTYVDPQNIFASGNLFSAVPKAKLWTFQLVRCNMINWTWESTSRRNSVFHWHNGLYFNEMGFEIMSRLQFHFKLGFKVKLVLFVHNGADHSVLFHRAWVVRSYAYYMMKWWNDLLIQSIDKHFMIIHASHSRYTRFITGRRSIYYDLHDLFTIS